MKKIIFLIVTIASILLSAQVSADMGRASVSFLQISVSKKLP